MRRQLEAVVVLLTMTSPSRCRCAEVTENGSTAEGTEMAARFRGSTTMSASYSPEQAPTQQAAHLGGTQANKCEAYIYMHAQYQGTMGLRTHCEVSDRNLGGASLRRCRKPSLGLCCLPRAAIKRLLIKMAACSSESTSACIALNLHSSGLIYGREARPGSHGHDHMYSQYLGHSLGL